MSSDRACSCAQQYCAFRKQLQMYLRLAKPKAEGLAALEPSSTTALQCLSENNALKKRQGQQGQKDKDLNDTKDLKDKRTIVLPSRPFVVKVV